MKIYIRHSHKNKIRIKREKNIIKLSFHFRFLFRKPFEFGFAIGHFNLYFSMFELKKETKNQIKEEKNIF